MREFSARSTLDFRSGHEKYEDERSNDKFDSSLLFFYI